jgi:uncharacterized protein (DUF983 family)
MNQKEEGFLGGVLVLGFALFIVGFLAGVVAAFVSISAEPAWLELIIFVFGLMTGIVALAIMQVIVKSRKFARRPS